MTEKRFSCTENGFVVDYESEHKLLNLYDAVDCLNALSDENEQLKQELSIREDQIQQITVAAYTDQYKEAEKYRKKFIRLCDELAEDEITIGNLKKENEKLKEENEKYKQSNREAIKIVERYNRLLKELGYD